MSEKQNVSVLVRAVGLFFSKVLGRFGLVSHNGEYQLQPFGI